jgi:MFS family permease
MFITFPFFSLYIQALGGSVVDIGIVNSLRPLIGIFIFPIAGYLSDHYNRVKIIAITSYFSALLFLIFMFAPDWRMLAIGNLLMGLNNFLFPSFNSLMADSLPIDKRGLGYSLWTAIPSIFGIVSPYFGGYLMTKMGVEPAMRLLYGITVITGILIATMNLKYLVETPRIILKNQREGIFKVLLNSFQDIFDILRRLPRNLKALALMLSMSFFFNNTVSSYWVVYAIEEIGLTKIEWGTVLLASAIVSVILLIPAGIIVDRLGAQSVLTLSLLTSAIPVLFFPFINSFLITIIVVVIGTITNSFLMSGAPTYMAQAVPAEIRGRVMATLGQGMLFVNIRGGGGGGPGMGALLTIPTVIGFLVGGYVYNYSPKLLWLLFGASMIVSAIISYAFLGSPQSIHKADSNS